MLPQVKGENGVSFRVVKWGHFFEGWQHGQVFSTCWKEKNSYIDKRKLLAPTHLFSLSFFIEDEAQGEKAFPHFLERIHFLVTNLKKKYCHYHSCDHVPANFV